MFVIFYIYFLLFNINYMYKHITYLKILHCITLSKEYIL